jgi:hypothetical protein
MEKLPQIGDRIVDNSAPPDDIAVRDWIGPEPFEHWTELQGWIEAFYPGVFAAEWINGGKRLGWSLRYKKTKTFCTLIPEYRRLSVEVVLGGAERDKFVERRHLWRPNLIELYDNAQTYPDGKFLTAVIATFHDRNDVTELLTMKRPPSLG